MSTLTTAYNTKTDATKAAKKFGGRISHGALGRLFVQHTTDQPFRDGRVCRAKFGAVEARVSNKNLIPLGNE